MSSLLLEHLHYHSASVGNSDIYENILVSFEPERILLVSTNLSVMRMTHLPIGGMGVGEVIVDHNKLTNAVTSLKGDVVLSIQGRTLTLNKTQVRMSGQDPDLFPAVPSLPEPDFYIASGAALGEAVRRCMLSATTEKQKRPNLEGLSFTSYDNGKALEIVGANGLVASIDTTVKTDLSFIPDDFKVFIQRKQLPAFALMEGKIGVTLTEKLWLQSDIGCTMFRLQNHNMDLDIMRKWIPKGPFQRATVDSDVFKSAYKLTSDLGTTFEGTLRTSVSFLETEMVIENFDKGEHYARTAIPCAANGAARMIIDQKIDENLDYLVRRYKRITFEYTSPTLPYIVTSDELPGFQAIIMAMAPK